MPLCGFNEKMLNGLTCFNEGLFEHGIIKRAAEKGISIDQMIETELADMNRFLAATPELRDPRVKKMVEGITMYAQGLYWLAQEVDINQYKTLTARVRGFFYIMDEKFYRELEGKPDDMR